MPQIGALAPGLWLASAFGGHGINTTAMAGELIAGAIVDGDDRWRLFQPFELVWAGGRLGRAVASAHFWARRTREDVLASLARRREAARRAAAEPEPVAPQVRESRDTGIIAPAMADRAEPVTEVAAAPVPKPTKAKRPPRPRKPPVRAP